jgi:hypothetical protein
LVCAPSRCDGTGWIKRPRIFGEGQLIAPASQLEGVGQHDDTILVEDRELLILDATEAV